MRPGQREEQKKYLNRQYGFDKPLPIQYLRWLNNVSPIGFDVNEDASLGRFGFKVPSLGKSASRGRPVLTVISEALPLTLLLNAITIPAIYIISIGTGIRAARRRGEAFDLVTGTTLVALWSLPVMWVAVMAIGFLANKQYAQIFPTNGLHDVLAPGMRFLPSWRDGQFRMGYLVDTAWHLLLPVLCLTYGGFAVLTKLMRAAVLENITADFARTARAKGLSETAVIYRHVLRNSVLPLITVAASILPGLLAGSIFVESVFSIEGMGRLMIDAINTRDRDLILSETLIVSVLSLVCLLIADICYAIADPRVSYE
jgi:peptide/nickel transport system permease protein